MEEKKTKKEIYESISSIFLVKKIINNNTEVILTEKNKEVDLILSNANTLSTLNEALKKAKLENIKKNRRR
jgi:hypothetical protein